MLGVSCRAASTQGGPADSRGVGAGSAANVRLYLRTLIPEGAPCLSSRLTSDWFTERLATYEGGRSTLRFVASV